VVILLDENVPTAVGEVFRAAGYTVLRVGDARCLPGSPDPVIAESCEQTGDVLVTWNRRDFKALSAGFKRMSWIGFKVPENEGAEYATRHLRAIAFHYDECASQGRRLWIEIQRSGIKVLETT
jgi:predicted nuclease of predicted toxin-antitoxin system